MKGLHKKMNWIALSAEQLDVVRDLNCAKHNFTQNRRFSSLPRRNKMKPGHLHKKREALLACPP